MTATAAPSLRIAPAVWTGNQMIVWGGYNGNAFLNDGSRYNPLSNSWSATTISGAPSARNGPAVWTGNEMIIWGGGFNTGGRYNPSANSWMATTNIGAPIARSSHAAVWTGTEMIVWGGFGIGVQNSGGRYNPAANSWTATTTNGAPSTRYNNTAVWTGSEMIVWGGFGSSAFNNGGRYNPQSNSWTAIANNGAPSPRYYHTAVWTGSEMIVWGGYNGSIYMNDGGRYNPVTDTWTPLPASTPCQPGFPDDFSCRETLFGSNLSFSVSNVGATLEPGEPSHFVDPNANPAIPEAGASLWYSWTAPFSGGAVITSTSTNNNYFTPCLAVYTGNSFSNLSRIATNVSHYSLSRVAFNAVQGSNYLVAVAGVAYLGSSGSGAMNVHLTLTPPPANDLFANRLPAASLFYETSGSFVGATREPGEPAHTNSLDFASWPQTLWWKWTAPTDLEVSAVPVKLTADGIGFTPNIGVYTGPSVSTLTSVVASAQSGGMSSRVAGFQAEPGTTYQIALGGRQHDPKIGSTQFGEFQFRLNVRALVLSSGNLNFTNNFSDYTVAFGANLQVTNLGSADSAPLRVRVTAILGSVLTAGAVPTSSAQVLLLTTNLPALSSGQGVVRRINGIVPPPANDANTNETG